jgi:beta-N-acetylhexosaminidase
VAFVAAASALVPFGMLANGTGASSRYSAAGPLSSRTAIAAACVTPQQLKGWSDTRLAMQTIAVPVEETDLGAVEQEVTDGAGGILLFGTSAPANLGAQVASLEHNFVPGHLGLLVMTDEEGGGVQRMANLVGNLPWAYQMNKWWDAAQIEAAAEGVAKKMAAAHVNMDLAPVVDVDGTNAPPSNSDPDGWRSFSGHTSYVVRDGKAFMAGLMAGGVIPVLKHFPGLGGVSGNTDVEAAHTLPWSTLQQVALPPFVKAIRAGAPAIMVSNATVPGLASYPASLSPAAIGRELVKTLGFKGLILTDSLSAVSISAAGFTVPQAAVQALIAGADTVLFGSNTMSSNDILRITNDIATAINQAVASGHLLRSRLIAAATAGLAARHRICL